VGPPKGHGFGAAGRNNIVMGIGLYAVRRNSRAVAAMWMQAKTPDGYVRFLGGHGTNNPDGTRMNPYNNTHMVIQTPLSLDAQYPASGCSTWGWTFAESGRQTLSHKLASTSPDTKTEATSTSFPANTMS